MTSRNSNSRTPPAAQGPAASVFAIPSGAAGQPDPLTVTVQEAKRLTGLSDVTIYKLMKEGVLWRTKVGRRTLISYRSLCALIGIPECTYVSKPNDGEQRRRVAK